jgi:O-antigen ligase/tetratricopeptide (TPR) repeat protein
MPEVLPQPPPKAPFFTWIAFFLIALAAILPIVHSKTAIYGTVVHRTLIFWGIIDTMLLLLCLRWKNKIFSVEKSPLTVSILVYTVIVFIANLLGEDVRLNLFSNFERMMGFVNLVHLVGFYFFFSRTSLSQKHWVYLYIIITAVTVYLCIFGLQEQDKFADKRIQSLLSNPMHFSGYLLTILFILLLALEKIVTCIKSALSKIGLAGIIATLFLLIYTLFLTKTRSGIIATGAGILVIFIAQVSQDKSNRKSMIVGLLFCTLIPTIIYLQRNAPWVKNNDILNRVTDLSTQSKTINTRLNLWKMALGGINDRPVLGWGQESFTYFYAKHYTPNLHGAGFWYDSAHNFFLDKLIQTGWIGLIAYLLVISAFFYSVWHPKSKLSQWQKSVISGYLVAYLIFLSFGFDSLMSLIGFFGLAAFVSKESMLRSNFSVTLPAKTNIALKVVFSILVITAFWKLVLLSFSTNRQLTSAYNQNEMEAMIVQHELTYQQALIGKYDAAVQYALKHNDVFQSGLPPETKNRYAQSANAMLTNALVLHPNHPVLLSQAGFVQFSGINHSLGIGTYRRLAQIAPKRQVNLLDLGIFYLQDNQFDKAMAIFDQVDRLDTSYQVPVIYKAYLLMKQHRNEESIQLLKMVNTAVWTDYLHVLRVMFREANQLQVLTDFINQTSFDDRIVFKQNTYLQWAQIGAELNDKVQIRTAYNSYANHYLKNKTLKNEQELIAECVNLGIQASEGKIPVETMTQYFNYFPGL